MTAIRLAHYDNNGAAELVIERDGVLYQGPPQTRGLSLDDVISDWAQWTGVLRDFLPTSRIDGIELLLPPVRRPGKILGSGANFVDHMAEMGLPSPPSEANPYLFLKPITALIGDRATVHTPTGAAARLDYEAELGVVVGRRGRHVSVTDAAEMIAGYVVVNDVSARAPFRVAQPLGPAFAFDWLAHKGQDGYCPVGPYFAPSWGVPDPGALRIRSWVNGDLRQDGTTADMIFTPERLISFASTLTTLEPGDLVLSGTPAGVAAASGNFVQSGDRVRIAIDQVGEVSTTFVEP